jgi:histidine triad (HIT) family protein
MTIDPSCIFCRIVAREAESSVLYEDEHVIAFMNIRPINRGEFMVIPKEHIGHFCDLSDELSCRILKQAQRLSRNLRDRLKPQRVGLVVHGYGVPHAHLVVVPLTHANDITSAKHVSIQDGRITYGIENLLKPTREKLDELAQLLG